MTALYQSPFLLALGWAIAASLWQVAVLWLLYQLVANRKTTPVFRHNLSVVLLVAASCWFGHTFIQKFNEFSAVSHAAGLSGVAVAEHAAGSFIFLQTQLFALLNRFLPYFSAAYLVILLLLTVRWMKAYAYSRRLQTMGLVAIDDIWIERVERYTNRLGIVQQVRIYLSEYIDVPATLNYFKPVILIPVAAFNQLTPEQVESVILHEMAHIKRKDYLVNILVSMMEILLFFNPFVHLLATGLRKERENCCDDFVLQFRFDPHSYASALLSLEQMRMNRLPATVLAATGNKNQLLGRVKRIMNVKSNNLNYGQRLLALFLVTFLLISLAWLAPEKDNHHAQDIAVDMTEAGFVAPEETVAEVPVKRTGKPASPQQPVVVNHPAPQHTVVADDKESLAGTSVVPAPPVPPVSPARTPNGKEIYDNYGEAWEKMVYATDDDNLVWKGKLEDIFGEGDVWKTLIPAKGRELLENLQEKMVLTKDTMQLNFLNQGPFWEQLSALRLAEIERQAAQMNRPPAYIFSYDSTMGRVMEFSIQRRQQVREQHRRSPQKRDTIHIKTTTPKKVKKAIWVNHVTDEVQKTYVIALSGAAGTLAEAVANDWIGKPVVAGLTLGKGLVLTID